MRKLLWGLMFAAVAVGPAHAQMKAQTTTPNSAAVTATPVAQPIPSLESARRITRDEAIKLVNAGKAVYVDVRSKESYDVAHIKGALSIPGSQLIARIREIPVGKTIVTYCA